MYIDSVKSLGLEVSVSDLEEFATEMLENDTKWLSVADLLADGELEDQGSGEWTVTTIVTVDLRDYETEIVDKVAELLQQDGHDVSDLSGDVDFNSYDSDITVNFT